MGKKVRKPVVREVVLDGSLTLAWYFKDEAVPLPITSRAPFPELRLSCQQSGFWR
jgi:hypothetical protein